jgi:hypothetical protein
MRTALTTVRNLRLVPLATVLLMAGLCCAPALGDWWGTVTEWPLSQRVTSVVCDPECAGTEPTSARTALIYTETDAYASWDCRILTHHYHDATAFAQMMGTSTVQADPWEPETAECTAGVRGTTTWTHTGNTQGPYQHSSEGRMHLYLADADNSRSFRSDDLGTDTLSWALGASATVERNDVAKVYYRSWSSAQQSEGYYINRAYRVVSGSVITLSFK